MNNRIFKIIQDLNGRVGLQWTEADKEELAELIVRECIRVSMKAAGLDAEYEAWYLIKEHFGVEW